LLKAFYNQLRDLCRNHGTRFGSDRIKIAQAEAEQACALAGEFGILRSAGEPFSAFLLAEANLLCGAEHFVDFEETRSRVVKVTIPPGFGLVPCVTAPPRANIRNSPRIPSFREQIEFIPATPLEYLDRWLLANEVFQDDVRLASVITWSDGSASISISQPQYHGVPATEREIETHFTQAGWTRCPLERGGTAFYNYAHAVLAIDVLPRNCYVNDGGILPFDVILQRPGPELERFLKLY